MVGGSGRIKGYTSGGADSDVVGRWQDGNQIIQRFENQLILLMDKIPNNHLGCIKPGESWGYLPSHLVQDCVHQQYDKYPTLFLAGIPILGAGFLEPSKVFKSGRVFLQQKHLKDLGNKSVYIMDIPMMDIP